MPFDLDAFAAGKPQPAAAPAADPVAVLDDFLKLPDDPTQIQRRDPLHVWAKGTADAHAKQDSMERWLLEQAQQDRTVAHPDFPTVPAGVKVTTQLGQVKNEGDWAQLQKDFEQRFPGQSFEANSVRDLYGGLLRAYRTAEQFVGQSAIRRDPGLAGADLTPSEREVFLAAVNQLGKGQAQGLGAGDKLKEQMARGLRQTSDAMGRFATMFGLGDADKVEQMARAGETLAGANPLEADATHSKPVQMLLNGMYWAANQAPAQLSALAIPGGKIANSVGQVAYWAVQMTPDSYRDMRQAGVNDTVAKPAALLSGLVQGAIEIVEKPAHMLGLGEAADVAMAGAKRSARAYAVRWAKEVGKSWFKEAVLEEGLQAMTQTYVKALATAADKDAPAMDSELLQQEMAGWGQQVYQAALSVPFMMGAGWGGRAAGIVNVPVREGGQTPWQMLGQKLAGQPGADAGLPGTPAEGTTAQGTAMPEPPSATPAPAPAPVPPAGPPAPVERYPKAMIVDPAELAKLVAGAPPELRAWLESVAAKPVPTRGDLGRLSDGGRSEWGDPTERANVAAALRQLLKQAPPPVVETTNGQGQQQQGQQGQQGQQQGQGQEEGVLGGALPEPPTTTGTATAPPTPSATTPTEAPPVVPPAPAGLPAEEIARRVDELAVKLALADTPEAVAAVHAAGMADGELPYAAHAALEQAVKLRLQHLAEQAPPPPKAGAKQEEPPPPPKAGAKTLTKETDQPARSLKFRERLFVMGHPKEAEVTHREVFDGVEYVMLEAPDAGFVRIMDLDAGKVVAMTKYPSVATAYDAYGKYVRHAKETAVDKGPAETPAPATAAAPVSLADAGKLSKEERDRLIDAAMNEDAPAPAATEPAPPKPKAGAKPQPAPRPVAESEAPPKAGAKPRTAKENLGSAADNVKQATDEALKGLRELFGPGRLSMLGTPAINEVTYRKAKPHFVKAYHAYVAAGADFLAFVRQVKAEFGAEVAPYLKRFMDDVAAGDLTVEGKDNGNSAGAPPVGGDGAGEHGNPVAEGAGVPAAAGESAGAPGVGGGEGGASNGAAADNAPGPAPVANGGNDPAGSGNAAEPGRPGGANPEPAGAGGAESVPGQVDGGVAPSNNRIGPDDVLVPGGAKTRARANLKAIRLAQKLEDENRPATKAEQKTLAQFVGWGALAPVFDDTRQQMVALNQKYKTGLTPDVARWDKQWGELHRELKGAMTQTEWDTARASTLNAHYTSREIISAIWTAVERLGFRAGNVLEPGAGVGHFIGLIPDALAPRAKFVAVEMDKLTGLILSKLYPEAQVAISPLQAVKLPPNTMDLVVGNVPFEATSQADAVRRYGQELNLHNYFIARAMDALRPGGVAVLISTSGTMDAQIKQREYLAGRAELLGAIRLPNNAFDENAGTEVTTDILVLRKPLPGQPVGGEKWAGVQEVKTGETAHPTAMVNEYFARHPEMMLGRPSMEGKLHGKSEKGQFTLQPTPGAVLTEQLATAIKALPAGIMETAPASPAIDLAGTLAAQGLRQGSLSVRGGKLVVAAGDGFTPAEEHLARLGTTLDDKTRATWQQRARAYVKLRDVWTEHAATMADPEATAEEIEAGRVALNGAYDAYQKNHGLLNDPKTKRAVSFDPSYYLVAGLETLVETVGDDGKVSTSYQKADAFSKRTIFPYQAPTTAATIGDAVRVSLGYEGAINVPYMAKLLGQTEDEVRQAMIDGNLAYLNPVTSVWETANRYLSGDVRAKLREAKVAHGDDPVWERNVKALEAVQPAPKKINELSIRLGATWIPEIAVRTFARYAMRSGNVGSVTYNEVADEWKVEGFDSKSAEAKNIWGTDRVPFPRLLEKILNLRSLEVRDQLDDKRTVRNEADTVAAEIMADKLQKEFVKLMTSMPPAMKALEDAYNEKMNFWVDPKWDGAFLDLPGSNQNPDAGGIALRDYQRDTIWRLLQDGCGLVAHAVGAGKTYVLAATAMEMRRMGLARKPMIVVQNATLGQFAANFKKLYPAAKVAVVTKEDLQTENRRFFMARIASGDFDAVILPQSQFDNLPLSPEEEKSWIEDELQRARAELAELAAESDEGNLTVKAMEKAIKALEQKLDKANDRLKKRDDSVYFDQLGVDAILVDEAHDYKKPFFVSKIDSAIKGIQRSASGKALGLQMKAQWIQRSHKGRNVILATGTPITNTLGESWQMIRLTAPHLLAKFNVSTFDRFASTFAKTEDVLTMNAGGNWVYRRALSKFINGVELAKLLNSAFAIFNPEQVRDAMGEMGQFLPSMVSGKPLVNQVEQSPGMVKFTEFVSSVYNAYQGLRGFDKKKYNWVPAVLYGAARAAALDIRLVYPNAKEEAGSKVNVCAQNVFNIWQKTKADKGTQMVFCDQMNKVDLELLTSFAGGKGVRLDTSGIDVGDEDGPVDLFLYHDLRNKLIAMGIPPEQVAIVHEAKDDGKRMALFERVKRGDVRVVLGSTRKMGTGVNAQDKLYAIHHLDAPWMPSELEQREGRILRWGNQYAPLSDKAKAAGKLQVGDGTVEVHSYVMKRTLDAAIYAKLLEKSKFIWQAMSGALGNEYDDPNSAQSMSMGEMMAAAADRPELFEKLKLEDEVRRLGYERTAHKDAEWRRKSDLAMARGQVNGITEQLPVADKVVAFFHALSASPLTVRMGKKEFGVGTADAPNEAGMESFNAYFSEVMEAAKAEAKANKNAFFTVRFGTVRAQVAVQYDENHSDPYPTFTNFVSDAEELGLTSAEWSIFNYPHPGDRTWRLSSAKTATGLLVSARAIEEHQKSNQAERLDALERANATVKTLSALVDQPWERQAELDQKNARIDEIEAMLTSDHLPNPAPGTGRDILADDEEDDGEDSQALRPRGQSGAQMLDEVLARTYTGGEFAYPRPMEPTDGAPKVPVSAQGIVAAWAKLLGIPLRTGRLPGSAAGIYRRFLAEIRLKSAMAGDVAVAAHEAAHHVDNMTKLTKGTGGMLSRELRAEVRRLDYEPEKARPHEGFAEFVRLWLTQPDEAKAMAPKFLAWWETEFPKRQPEWAAKMQAMRGVYQQYHAQGAVARVQAQINHTGKPAAPAGQQWTARLRDFTRDAALRVYTLMVDRGYTLKLFDKASGGGKAGAYDVWLALDGTSGALGKHAVENGVFSLREGSRVFGPGLREVLREINDGADREQFTAYAYARHAREAWLRGVNPGISADDAEYTYQKLRNDRYERAAQGLTAYNNALLDMMVDAGVIEKRTATKLQGHWQTYIPLFRVPRGKVDSATKIMVGGRLVNPATALKSRKGSGEPIMDPIAATVQRTVQLYQRASQQLVIEQVVERAMGTKGMGGWLAPVAKLTDVTKVTVKEIIEKLVAEGADLDTLLDAIAPDGTMAADVLAFYQPSLRIKPGEPVVRVLVEGEMKLFECDKDFFEFLMGTAGNMARFQLPAWLDMVFGKGARLYKLGATGLNLAFAAKNPIRDFPAFLIQRKYAVGARGVIAPAEMVLTYVWSQFQQAMGNDGDPVVKLWKQYGGQLGTSLGLDRHAIKGEVERLTTHNVAGRTWDVLKDPVDLMREIVGISEVGPRLAEFRAALAAHGYTRARMMTGAVPPLRVVVDAVNAAHDVTVNFKRAGTLGRQINEMVPFFNAGVQSVDKFARTWKDNPKKALFYSLLMASATMMYWARKKDEDWYQEAPPWLRYGFWTVTDEHGRPTVRVPRPFEWGWTTSASVEALMNWLYKHDERAMGDWAKGTLDLTLPSLAPSLVTPAAEAYFNWDFFRAQPIVSDAQQHLPAADQYSTYNTLLMRQIGKVLGVSPARLEHAVNQMTGGMYRQAEAPVEALVAGRTLDTADEPLVSGFTLRRDFSRTTDDFYSAKQELAATVESQKLHGQAPNEADVLQLRRLEQYAELMQDIRRPLRELPERDARFGGERLLIGLARDAMGEAPLARYPSLFTAPDLTPEQAKVRDQFYGRLLWHATAPAPTRERGEPLDKYDAQRAQWEDWQGWARGELDRLQVPMDARFDLLDAEIGRRGGRLNSPTSRARLQRVR